jgi:hypothetical protein
MASIFLTRRELGGTRLPRVCVVCGRRGRLTEVTLRHQSGILGFSSGIRIITTQEAALPLCSEHEDHFRRLNKVALVGFAILALLMACAVGAFFLVGLGAFAIFFLPFVAGVVIVGLLSHFVHTSRTHAASIDDSGVLLAQVSEEFVEALEDPDAADRPRRRRSKARPGVPAWAWLAGGGAVLLVLLTCGGVGAVFLASRSSGGPAGPGNQIEKTSLGMSGREQGRPPGGPGGERKLTQENFHKIKRKMTPAEVQEILGPPQEEDQGVQIWIEGRYTIQVQFKDDRVVGANVFIDGRVLTLVDEERERAFPFPMPPR